MVWASRRQETPFLSIRYSRRCGIPGNFSIHACVKAQPKSILKEFKDACRQAVRADLKKAKELGVPLQALSTTPSVVNTAEEAFAIKKTLYLLNGKAAPNIILVTSAFHMQRAKRQFERQGFIVHPFPVDFKTSKNSDWRHPYKWMPNASSLYKSSTALREFLGRAIYKSW